MQLYATADIHISSDKIPLTLVPKLRRELDDAIEQAADAVLERHGIANDEIHTSILSELFTDEDDEG